MRLNSYILKKFFLGISISVFTCLTIFFLFSIIGSLGENLNFYQIVVISFINSLQLIFLIPTYILLFSIYVFWYLINIKNEIIVIKQYFSKPKVLFVLIFFTLSFAMVEVKKDVFVNKLEKAKIAILDKAKNFDFKLIVLKDHDNEKYYLFKDINFENNFIEQFNYYEIENYEIKNSIFSEKVPFMNDLIYLTYYYEQEKNKINKKNNSKIIKINNLSNYLNLENHVKLIKTKKDSFNFVDFEKFFYFFILNCLLILIIINHSSLLKKDNLINSILISIILIIYSYVLFTITLQSFNFIFLFLGFTFIFLNLIKKLIYE